MVKDKVLLRTSGLKVLLRAPLSVSSHHHMLASMADMFLIVIKYIFMDVLVLSVPFAQVAI